MFYFLNGAYQIGDYRVTQKINIKPFLKKNVKKNKTFWQQKLVRLKNQNIDDWFCR